MEAESLKINQHKLSQFLESEHTISCITQKVRAQHAMWFLDTLGQGMSVTPADSLEQKRTLNCISWRNIVYKSGLKHTHTKNKKQTNTDLEVSSSSW